MKYIFQVVVFFVFSNCFSQQVELGAQPLVAKDSLAQKVWVDSILKNMSLEEKIGQLFMVQAYSNKDDKHKQEINSLIQNQHVGGLIFMQGTPEKQIDLYNEYQANSKIPLLIGFDGEWGLSMRIKPSFAYPWNMTLGAIQNDSLIYRVGQQIGKHCKEVGIHINFAPVVDINTNPLNPIIGNRSFGENKKNVTQKSIAFVQGMQSVGVLANAKHFPGHGDTASDSHKTLPVVNFTMGRLDSLELYPYKQLVKSNLASVMVAHLDVPALKTEKGRPTSISKKVVTGLLKNKIGFKGLVFTDALNMKGVANYTAADSVALEALKAGNDMLLIPVDVEKGVKTIKNAILKNVLTEARLDSSVVKVLMAKYCVGLQHKKVLNKIDVQQRIHTIEDDLLFKKVAENAVTLVKNENNLLPLKRLDTLKVASVSLGDDVSGTFVQTLKKYTAVDEINQLTVANYKSKLKNYNTIVIGVHKSDEHPWKSYKLSSTEVALIQKMASYKKVILTVFTSPYSLLKLNGFDGVSNLVVAYQNNSVFQSVAAQQLFGALPFTGKLPVSVSQRFKEGSGITTQALQRLQYGFPEEEGMDSYQLKKIDSVAQLVIKEKMSPGLQVLVARKGKVVFEKSYGYFTYDAVQKVNNTSMYDLASLTKILGAFPLYVKALEKGVYRLDQTLGDLLPMYKNTPLEKLLVIDMFAHQSGLQAWIPFYVKTLDSVSKKPMDVWYKNKAEIGFDLKVAENLYLKNEYIDSIYQEIKVAPLRKTRDYKYSGLPFFLFKKVLENHYQQPMDVLLNNQFTKKLGASTLMYNPLEMYAKDSIVPSELDTYYRYQKLQGTVHDMAAAMFGGVSGNAGLFGNANDVAKMMQLYLNKGAYGGEKYFRENTFDMFNKAYFKSRDNRRGLVLDKPSGDAAVKSTCNCTSMESFGHSGFTGTFAWADPKTELIYVFLSNRTYPTMANNALGTNDIRTDIQQLIQDAIVE
ncbi:glycoside hydrolase family 3 N-terminal domain-containing protein [Wenyingzhuangia aestuarii]|uniref:glycoside hydrolase family 3 N-terminal domain-containing protein n=1 Tax=Wenyingzhuangia aestuarii TaxID=1647582 RepID=UPI00143AEF62|nr:glycoside hydrolase family 3 N-terminal domain-containing protein [Wenyingzhuangia aestuarii]NJB81722.1 beta-glucosidase-like glycosyl hydrolase/CubicO group peptidase (beta-lactamase class C family) [Wenyingzhuangia aestuarii]